MTDEWYRGASVGLSAGVLLTVYGSTSLWNIAFAIAILLFYIVWRAGVIPSNDYIRDWHKRDLPDDYVEPTRSYTDTELLELHIDRIRNIPYDPVAIQQREQRMRQS